MTTTFPVAPLVSASDLPGGPWLRAGEAPGDPLTGLAGETVLVRDDSISGEHRAGLWRTDPDVRSFAYAAPAGDLTLVILKGSATLTATASGATYEVRPGTTLSQPRDLALSWEVGADPLRAFWVHWRGPEAGTTGDTLFIGHIDDDGADAWEPYEWVDEDGEVWNCGQNNFLRVTGSTGSLRCGIWRNGPAPAAGDPLPVASGTGRCSGRHCAGHLIGASRGKGDETMILIDGTAHIENHDSGREVDVAADDIIGQYLGPQITWTSTAPYMRKFFVMTNADPAA